MTEKIKLPYINKGKAFDLPNMTVAMNEKYLDILAEKEKEFGKDNLEKINREANKHFLLYVLKQIDDTVTLDTILNMHPNDFLYLFNSMWESGELLTKKGDDTNFRKS